MRRVWTRFEARAQLRRSVRHAATYPAFDDAVPFQRDLKSVSSRVDLAGFVNPLAAMRAAARDLPVSTGDSIEAPSALRNSPTDELNRRLYEWSESSGYAPLDSVLNHVFRVNASGEVLMSRRGVAVQTIRRIACERRWPVEVGSVSAAAVMLEDCAAALSRLVAPPPLLQSAMSKQQQQRRTPSAARAHLIFERIVLPTVEALVTVGALPTDDASYQRHFGHLSADGNAGELPQLLAASVNALGAACRCFASAFNDATGCVTSASLSTAERLCAVVHYLYSVKGIEAEAELLSQVSDAGTNLAVAAFAADRAVDQTAFATVVMALPGPLGTTVKCLLGTADAVNSATLSLPLDVVVAAALVRRARRFAEASCPSRSSLLDGTPVAPFDHTVFQQHIDALQAQLTQQSRGGPSAPLLISAQSSLLLARLWFNVHAAAAATSGDMAGAEATRLVELSQAAEDAVALWAGLIADACQGSAGASSTVTSTAVAAAELFDAVLRFVEELSRLSLFGRDPMDPHYDGVVMSRVREVRLAEDEDPAEASSAARSEQEATWVKRTEVLRDTVHRLFPLLDVPAAAQAAASPPACSTEADSLTRFNAAAATSALAVAPLLDGVFAADPARVGRLLVVASRLQLPVLAHGILLWAADRGWKTVTHDDDGSSSTVAGKAESAADFDALHEFGTALGASGDLKSFDNERCIALLPPNAFEAAMECFKAAGDVEGCVLLRRAAKAMHDPHADDIVFDLFDLRAGGKNGGDAKR